jgi:hypothetical protein
LRVVIAAQGDCSQAFGAGIAWANGDRYPDRDHGEIQAQEMIGLDTKVLLRYLVQDDPVQSTRATEIIERHLSEVKPGFVCLVTVLEVVWC